MTRTVKSLTPRAAFKAALFLSMFNCVDTVTEKILDHMAARFGIL
nr:MAG TPA: hypothetical protein [Caudoviricetes sp.]